MSVQVPLNWAEVHNRTGQEQLRSSGRSRRGRCPFCGSRTGFSENEDLGLFHCFACGVRGDKVKFVELALETDFKGALRVLGLETGRPPAPSPERVIERRIIGNLLAWKRREGRKVRDRLLARNRIRTYAAARLVVDPEDATGWELLRIAFEGEAQDEHLAYCIDLAPEHDGCSLLALWREFRELA